MASGQMTVDRPEQLSMTFVHDWRITDRYFPRIRTFSLQQVNTYLYRLQLNAHRFYRSGPALPYGKVV